MSSNSSTASGFGRLNWNVGQGVTFTMGGILKKTDIVGATFELTVVIFLVVNFCYKKSIFREPYFIIYAMGCFIDAAPKVMIFCNTYIYNAATISCISAFFQWYNANFITLWNLLLALNRFTAIIFSVEFSKIWSKRNTTIICIFLALYSFLIHCFNFVYAWNQMTRFYWPLSVQMKNTARETQFEYVFAFISDITYAIISTVLCIIAALKILIKKQMKNQNVEKVLLIQSFTSSVFLLLSTAFSWLASVNVASADATLDEMEETLRVVYLQSFLNILSKYFYNFHHFVGLILLLVISRNFRTKYLKFYKLTVIFKCFKRFIKHKRKSATITVIPSASTTTSPRITHKTPTFLH